MGFSSDLIDYDWDIPSGYVKIAMDTHHVSWEKSTINRHVSLAMLNNQRVDWIVYDS